MAKLSNDPITKDDIENYLTENSDFSFEVSVLRKLSSLGFSCEHSGTYEDPITKKTREFDIRAEKLLLDEQNIKLNISLSVECKNIRNYFPLVIHCMPREEHECYLDLIWAHEPQSYIHAYEQAMRVPLLNEDCPYEKLMAVGKSSDQIGRKASQNSELIGNDGDVFDKISQAINSSYDLIKKAHYAADKNLDVVTLVVPVLVVPNDRIWSVYYKRTGEIEREPTIESNLEYYIGKSWVVRTSPKEFPKRYYLSHLEIVQIDSINKMIQKYTRMSSIASSNDLNTRKLRALEDLNR
ncbi:MAG: hypothetical protein HGA96_14730 [Desulfobulbaceae bacterium]|nr:hypothetical protein [Desulfobulbaceae bacterium]